MVFNVTFSYILAVSFIGGRNQSSWRKQTFNHWQTSQCCIEYTSAWAGFELTTLVMISTDCIGSVKSNYNRTMMAHVCRDSLLVFIYTRMTITFCILYFRCPIIHGLDVAVITQHFLQLEMHVCALSCLLFSGEEETIQVKYSSCLFHGESYLVFIFISATL